MMSESEPVYDDDPTDGDELFKAPMASAFSVDIRPTRRRPGYMAIVWSGWTTDRRVRQVFFGQRYDEVRADAEYYVRAVGGKGVES